MYESYLWNRRCGRPDPVVRELEHKLACKGYGAVTRRRWAKKLVGPAVLALDAAAVLLLVLVEAGGGGLGAPRDIAPPAPAVSFEQDAGVVTENSFVAEETELDVTVVDDVADDAAIAQK